MNSLRFVVGLSLLVFASCNGCDDLGEPTHANCGNEVVDGLEVCDGSALAGKTCASLGFSGGTLSCSPACGGFVVAGCEGIPNDDPCAQCGNAEQCVGGRCESICEGEAFTTDTTQSFDIEVVTLSGTVMVGGAPVDAAGSLRFEGTVYYAPAIVPVAADGSYAVRLQPDLYEVSWIGPDDTLVSAERLPDLDLQADATRDFELTPWLDVTPDIVSNFPEPLGELVVEPVDPRFGRIVVPLDSPMSLQLRPGDVRLWWRRAGETAAEFLETTSAEALTAIEIPVVQSSLRLTMNGAPVASDGDIRVELVRNDELPRPGWLSVNRDREAWTLDSDGRASGWVLDRPRDVALVINGPPTSGWLWAQRDAPLGPEMAIDVRAPRLAGEVRRNGGRLPNSALDGVARGRLEFTSEQGYLSTEVGDRGRADYDVRLPPGVWRARVSGVIFAGVLPVVPWSLPDPIALEQDIDSRVIDVPAVRLAGQLTVNGARPPDELELETRGSLQLHEPNSPIWYNVPIPARGPAAWDVVVAPGNYEAEIVRWWFASGGEPAPDGVLPLGNWAAGELEVPVATRYDVDVRLDELTIDVREGDSDAPAGLLWLTNRGVQRVARQIDTGTEPVTISLYPGHYEVSWAPYDDDGRASEPVVLDAHLAFDGAAERTYDVSHVRLAADITVNGEPAMDAGELSVALTRFPDANWTADVPLNPTGAAAFEADIVNGYYTIVLDGADDHMQLPAAGVVLYSACSTD